MAMREAFEAGTAAIPPNDDLLAELLALKYEVKNGGRTYIEPKDNIRDRIGHSPDLADVCAMAFGGAGPATRSPRNRCVAEVWLSVTVIDGRVRDATSCDAFHPDDAEWRPTLGGSHTAQCSACGTAATTSGERCLVLNFILIFSCRGENESFACNFSSSSSRISAQVIN